MRDAWIIAVLTPHAAAQLFVEADLGPFHMASGKAGGVCAVDYDNDGDIDVFAPTEGGHPDLLFRNDAGELTEIGAQAGLDSFDRHRLALFFDADADGLLDLIVGGDCWALEPDCLPRPITLYRQTAPSQFVDVTETCGITQPALTPKQHLGGACAADFDGDGRLDLVLSIWGGPLRLFRNTGSITFEEVTEEAGLPLADAGHYQPVAFDANDDGLMDIFCAVDMGPNQLWINDGAMSFTNRAAEAGVDYAFNEMGVAIADVDNDADLDLYVTAITGFDFYSTLFLKGDGLTYVESAHDYAVEDADWAWGATFGDFDHDTLVDLAVTNGWKNFGDPSRLFRNTGGAFDDVSDAWGFNDNDWGSALVSFDADRDGDLDLLQACAEDGPLRLLRNTQGGSWLVVRPRMSGPNSRAIGAVVTVEAVGVTMTRLITAGISMLGQEPAEAHVGLGNAEIADVSVRWPDGRTTLAQDVGANQIVELAPCDADMNADGELNLLDFVAFQLHWQAHDLIADCDANDQYTILDFVCFQQLFASGCD